MAELTLDRMAAGGIHDQLAGGFHRYAVDAIWLVPHFEKMLYDNALLARAYLAGLRGDGRAAPRRGRRLDARLPRARAAPAARRLRVGHRRRHRRRRGIDVRLDARRGARAARRRCRARRGAVRHHATRATSRERPCSRACSSSTRRATRSGVPAERLPELRRRMLEARALRPQPALDDKALASWNGMALAALAEGARVLDRPDLLEAAEQLRRVPARPAVPPRRHALALAPRGPQLDPRLPRRPRAGRRGPVAAPPRDARPALAGRGATARAARRRALLRPRRTRLVRHRGGRRGARRPAAHARRRSDALGGIDARRPARAPRATRRRRRARGAGAQPSCADAGDLPARAPQAFGNLLCVASALLADVEHRRDRRRADDPAARALGRAAVAASGPETIVWLDPARSTASDERARRLRLPRAARACRRWRGEDALTCRR